MVSLLRRLLKSKGGSLISTCLKAGMEPDTCKDLDRARSTPSLAEGMPCCALILKRFLAGNFPLQSTFRPDARDSST
jgi:hypothetical protein